MEFVCPNCHQVNEISGLPGTGGQFAVDCPYCHHGFTIQIDIQSIPDEAEDETVALNESAPEPDSAPTPAFEPALDREHEEETEAEPESAPPPEKPLRIELPEEARLEGLDHSDTVVRRSRGPTRFFGGLLSLVLLSTLALQQAYFRRDELANQDRLRPWLELMCQYAECKLAPRSAPDRLRISRPDVHLDDRYQNVLDASVLIRNEAGFPQAVPTLELSFFDLDHRLVASRRFKPREYLGHAADRVSTIPADGTLLANVQILDPGSKAMGFEFTVK